MIHVSFLKKLNFSTIVISVLLINLKMVRMSVREKNERIANTLAVQKFIRRVWRDDCHPPFDSAVSRHLLLNSLKFSDERKRLRQENDKMRYMKITASKILRPERGDTSLSNSNPENPVPVRSAFERVCKAAYRNTAKGTDLNDFNIATRFAAPVACVKVLDEHDQPDLVWIFVHFELRPINYKDSNGKSLHKDPRVFKTKKKKLDTYKVMSESVLTVELPNNPFIDKIFDPSPYAPGEKIDGRMSWEEFQEHHFFKNFCEALKNEVRNEKPDEHPLWLENNKLLESLDVKNNVVPVSPVFRNTRLKRAESYILDSDPDSMSVSEQDDSDDEFKGVFLKNDMYDSDGVSVCSSDSYRMGLIEFEDLDLAALDNHEERNVRGMLVNPQAKSAPSEPSVVGSFTGDLDIDLLAYRLKNDIF